MLVACFWQTTALSPEQAKRAEEANVQRLFMRAFRHLRMIAIALAILVLIGSAGFHYIEGWTWFDGLYMVVTTFTTIGYQEIHSLSRAARIFNLALIISGVSLVFLGI